MLGSKNYTPGPDETDAHDRSDRIGRNVEPFGRPTGHKTLVKLITQTIRYRQRDGDRRGR
jgi:hypothetical protein